jgi:hypothetical protein
MKPMSHKLIAKLFFLQSVIIFLGMIGFIGFIGFLLGFLGLRVEFMAAQGYGARKRVRLVERRLDLGWE